MRYPLRRFGPAALAALAAALILPACNPLEKESDSISQLLVVGLTGTTMEGNEANFLQSDVLFQNPNTGATSIIADTAKATLNARQLDPSPIMGPSVFADVTITSYAVSYFRSDGKNVQGVDVPYGFGGAVSILVPAGIATTLNFVIVRETAKQEAPLVNLLQVGTRAEVLAVTARVDFYGVDGSNKKVKATGYLPIYFANYANAGSGGEGQGGRR